MVAVVGPWEFGWEALVAIGTFLLALATVALALSTRSLAKRTAEEVTHSARQVEETRRQVAASQEQARIAQDALAAAHEQTRIAQLTLGAQIRPVLIDVPLDLGHEEQILYPGRREPVTMPTGGVHVFGDAEQVLLSVPVRNAGVGLAMIRGFGLRVGTPQPPVPATIRPANVAPGEYARISFAGSPEDAAFAAIKEAIGQGNLSVGVGYSDLAGQQYTVSRFDIYFRSRAHTNWEVTQVHLHDSGSDEPFAGSAPIG